jgi:adenylate cyclase
MSDIFISYARSTEPQARKIAEALRALGYGVWRDDELPAHRAYSEVIEERLKAAKAVVVLWSTEAVRSQWVRAEAEVAREAGTLVQASLDGSSPPLPFNQIQCADLADWNGEVGAAGWKKVANSIADLTRSDAPTSATTQPKATEAAPRASICVLPFANMSGDAEQEYFSDGISEDIITDLSKVSALDVTARNTAFTFKGRSVKVPEVAREVGVSHLLEGSVRKAGGRVRISAQLIDGATGNHLWAERYDRDLDDIFALQDEISRAIVAALKLKLLPDEKKAIAKRGTSNGEAYDLYLMARQLVITGNYGDPRREETMIRLCWRAVEVDPSYARAWALMAYAQSSLRYNRGAGSDDGLVAAERAIKLDPSLAEPHAVKARNLADHGRREEAFAELEVALSLDSESLEVTLAAATLHFNDKNFAAAERYYAKAVELDETNVGSPGMLTEARLVLGDQEGARRAAEITLARAEKVVARDPYNGNAMAFGVMSMQLLGQAERAREWMNRALVVDPENMLMRYNFACGVAAHLHDVDGALELIGPALATGTAALIRHAKVDPDLDSLRSDPRFVAMMSNAEARTGEAPQPLS